MGTCVYVGIMEDGSEVAVKRMVIQTSKTTAENEKAIFALINTKKSPFIVSYRSFLKDNIFMYLIVDLCEETLKDHILSQRFKNGNVQKNGCRMIKEILTGLEFLHSQKILHRDLKPSNVLVDVEDHMRLADFGISRVLNEDETTVHTSASGTQGWMPSEVIETANKGGKGRFKRKSDVQVAGMIAYFILSEGDHPFGSLYERMGNILKGNPVNLNNLDDLDARQFVSKLISHKIDDRPHAGEALCYSFISNVSTHWKENVSDTKQNFDRHATQCTSFSEEDENYPFEEDDHDSIDNEYTFFNSGVSNIFWENEDIDAEDIDPRDYDAEDIDHGDYDGEDIDPTDYDAEDIDPGDYDGEDIDPTDYDAKDIDRGDYDGDDIDPGDYDAEDIDPGDYDPGDIDPGDYDPGDYDAEDIDPGDYDPGDYDAEDIDPGDYDPGDIDPGDYDPGDYDAEDIDPGDYDPGDYDAEDIDPGDYDPGDIDPWDYI